MPKAGFLTAKAIGKRIKSKGLKKLRFYCQMCQKQCRDANGFKCHIMTEGHLRQMQLVAENPNKYVDGFSQDFETLFLELLARRFGEKRVLANSIYQEYISERNHVHMNSTMWDSLTSFVKYLGRTKKCIVDETERGWFVQWIRRDADGVAEREKKRKRRKALADDEERMARNLKRRVEAAARAASEMKNESSVLDDDEPLDEVDFERKISNTRLSLKVSSKKASSINGVGLFDDVGRGAKMDDGDAKEKASTEGLRKKKVSALDAIIMSTEAAKRRQTSENTSHHAAEDVETRPHRNRFEHWIADNIVVRVVNKTLGKGRFFRKKGTIVTVQDRFLATVKMLDGGATVRIDQDDLETVVPKPPARVLIVNGRGRGKFARVSSLDKRKYKATVVLKDGGVLEKDYEDICRVD
eukprot:g786.t1